MNVVPNTGRLGLASRWWLYQAERFPLGTHVPVIALFFANGYFAAQALAGHRPLHCGIGGMMAFATTFLTMLLLRVFDEFKDFEDDRVNHPYRVVQRGIVTMPELTRLSGVILGAMLLANIVLSWQAWVAFGLVIGFALLMRVEFFVPNWLRRHILTYAVVHQGIVPLLYVYLAVGAVGTIDQVPPKFWIAVVVAVGVGLCYELSRKFRAPEDETETLDTYTKRFGPRGAAVIAFLFLVLATSAGSGLCQILSLPKWAQILVTAALAIGGLGYAKYAAQPARANAKTVKDLASVAIVMVNLALVAGMVSSFGLVIGGR